MIDYFTIHIFDHFLINIFSTTIALQPLKTIDLHFKTERLCL